METRIFNGIKFCIHFKEDNPRNIPAKFGLNCPSGLEEIDDDARLTPGDPESSPGARCAQVN